MKHLLLSMVSLVALYCRVDAFVVPTKPMVAGTTAKILPTGTLGYSDKHRIALHAVSTKEEEESSIKEQENMKEPDCYIEQSTEAYFDGIKPDSSWNLALANFMRQGKTILEQLAQVIGLKEKDPFRPPACLDVHLSNEAVKEAERKRIARGEGVDAHPVALALYDLGCLLLDELFDERPIPRFWFLETIARIPYFAYVSVLHLYESLGWWRAVELRKVHSAEDWNELHHLLIMESLGGNALWSDRFLGYHAAILYYFLIVFTYFGSPRVAYQFMELLEAHAGDTYGTFVEENRQRLRELPPPRVAKSYYTGDDLYLFDDFQMRKPGSRRPPCNNLLDVFQNIVVDEGEHVKTMKACQDYASMGTKIVSPHVKYSKKEQEEAEQKKRQQWIEWSKEINNPEEEED